MINKTDLAEAVGADLDLMKREADVIRGGGPVVMAQVCAGDAMVEAVRLAWGHDAVEGGCSGRVVGRGGGRACADGQVGMPSYGGLR